MNEDNTTANNNIQNFLNFIDQSNKQPLSFNVPPHIFQDKTANEEGFQQLKKKDKNVGNKINYVIEDLLEAKANSSTMTESTVLTQKLINKKNKKNKNDDYNENSFLKEFTQKFIKRETIDKKILRAFRKYLKKESSKILKTLESKKFWIIFIKENILPPMKLVNSELKINV